MHTQQAPLMFIDGLPEIQGATAERWLASTAKLVADFSNEVNGDDEHALGIDAMALHIAAVSIWLTSRGRPCWSKLDVESWYRLASSLPIFEPLGSNIVMSTMAFYCFLNKHRLISNAAAVRISDKLEKYALPIMHQVLGAASYLDPPAVLN